MCLKAHSGISIWCLENLYIFPQSETDSMHMHMNLGELQEFNQKEWKNQQKESFNSFFPLNFSGPLNSYM